MITHTTSPQKSLLLLEIFLLLEDMPYGSIFAMSIHLALNEGRIKEAVKEIYEQSKDNRPLVSHIVGEKTLVKVEKYFSE